MDFESSSIEVDDFTGGQTDFFMDGTKEEYQYADNFLITSNKKLLTRPGSEVYNTLVYQIPDGTQRIGAAFSFESNLFIQSARNIYIAGASSWTTIATVNPAFASNLTSNFISKDFWNGHILLVSDSFCKPIKIFNDSGTYKIRTAGLPQMAAPLGAGTAGSNSYLYAFTYFVSYVANGVTFEDEGPTKLLSVASVNAPDVNQIAITGIPELVNMAADNYDVANIKVKIYRTQTGGTVFYYVGQVDNGTTTYNDTTSDATIVANNILLYINGGVLDNDSPPPAKFFHMVNGYGFYAHIKEEDGVVYPNRFRQSLKDNPDAVPVGNFEDVSEPITGFSSFNSVPIVFTASKIYRVEGTFDELGAGGMTATWFSETIGAINHNSIVQTRYGVFFCGNDGFYWTDGYDLRRISKKLINTYAALTEDSAQRSNIYGTYDQKKDLVIWSMGRTTAADDNDCLFVLDLKWGIRDNSVFTSWSGGTSFSPTAICMHQGELIRADRRGYIFKHDDSFFTDPKINTLTAPSLWTKQVIVYDYITCAINFGIPQIRKWVGRMLASVRNISNVSLQVYSHNDDSNFFRPLVEIKDDSQPIWGQPELVWGDDSIWWNFAELIEQERRFPKNTLRCSYKQLRFTNAYTIISKSDNLGTASVSATTKVATLNTALITWPADAMDYYISFDTDLYVKEYLVVSQSGNALTFSDPLNQVTTGASKKWMLKGYSKGEGLNLLGFVIYFTPFSKTFSVYRGSNANA